MSAMTKHEAVEAIKILQAFIEGKKIEYKGKRDDQWRWCEDPGFEFSSYRYRIKPKTPQDITREQAAVMIAWADGGEVECRDRTLDGWCSVDTPSWNWGGYEYRVKESP